MFSKEVPASDTNLDYRAKRFGSSHEGISLTAFLFVCLFVLFVLFVVLTQVVWGSTSTVVCDS